MFTKAVRHVTRSFGRTMSRDQSADAI